MCWSLDSNDVHAARSARSAATATLRQITTSADNLVAAELVIGELLSNTVRHADGYACLELRVFDGNAEVCVHDTSPAFALDIRPPNDDFSECGRGLFIVSELALRIRVAPADGIGKCVSVVLDLPIDPSIRFLNPCGRPWLRHVSGPCMAPRLARFHPELMAWPT